MNDIRVDDIPAPPPPPPPPNGAAAAPLLPGSNAEMPPPTGESGAAAVAGNDPGAAAGAGASGNGNAAWSSGAAVAHAAGTPRPQASDDGAEDESDVFSDDDDLRRDEEGVRGYARGSIDDTWQDDLIETVPLRGNVAPEEHAAFHDHVAALLNRRLLLVRHAPTPAAGARATAALRAVVSELLQREPQRYPLSSKHDRPFAPQSLAHTPFWRSDRYGSVIYLFRSEDPDSLGFFNRQIEPVRDLCRTLGVNDSYLLVTVAIPDTAALCEESLLAEEVALWHLREPLPAAPGEAPIELKERFDILLVACAALFPGLGFTEFGALVEWLAPPLPLEWARADAAAPRSRHQRWYAGERDAVRAELHVALRAPHTLEDVATADASAESGMYLDTRERRVGMPDWLYEHHLSALDEMAQTLVEGYFAEGASPRLRVGYRRLLLRLDALGVRRLNVDWVAQQLQTGLDAARLQQRLWPIVDLLAEVASGGDPRQFAARSTGVIAGMLPLIEQRLVANLQAGGTLAALAAQRATPYAPAFWAKVRSRAESAALLARARDDLWDLIYVLLRASQVTPAATIATLVRELERSNAVHLEWLGTARLKRGQKVPVSLARMAARDVLRIVLRQAPQAWLALAEALIVQCRPGPGGEAPPLRWLARDFVAALAANGDGLAGGGSSTELYRALLGNAAARERLAGLLPPLLAAAARQEDGAQDGADIRIALAIYHALALSLLRHASATPEQLLDLLAGLSRPWARSLRPARQRDVVEAARAQLQHLQQLRRRHFGDAGARKPDAAALRKTDEAALRKTDEAVRALQILSRSWQPPASGTTPPPAAL